MRSLSCAVPCEAEATRACATAATFSLGAALCTHFGFNGRKATARGRREPCPSRSLQAYYKLPMFWEGIWELPLTAISDFLRSLNFFMASTVNARILQQQSCWSGMKSILERNRQ